ncbi:hypothetical protein [Thomasclavelia cocleata]|jgi:hypothetical protein|uniref:hypothetical protein n=1 Tax=Thomasclavelia cocleata TaxID=69824 RepID=UPI00256F64B2|nr:hypothetical protein [Thomasclavelia cocleata]
MKIINTDNVSDNTKRILFTVELETKKYVDVMMVFNNKDNPLIYIMQNEDGSTVYGEDKTYLNYSYNEKEVIKLVSSNKQYCE